VLLNESLWFREKMKLYIQKGDVFLNLGSSTNEFRKKLQPHVHANLIQPLETKAVKIYHVDIKQDDGVDLVGDIINPNFLEQLKKLAPAGLICSNLLEHLKDRENFSRSIVELIPAGGYVFASCPKDYPYHPDPIDTMFRPTLQELAAEFPSTRIIEGEIVSCGTWREKEKYDCGLNYSAFYFRKARQLIRMFVPFYKPKEWLDQIWGRNRIDPNHEISATCVILQKV
jgi:hypothetical protein